LAAMVKERRQPIPALDPVNEAVSKLDAKPGDMAEVYDACMHAYVMVRETAVEELAETMLDPAKVRGDKQTAQRELLKQIVESEEKYIREKAARAIGTVAAANIKVCDAVMVLLSSADSEVREAGLLAVRARLHSEATVAAIQNAQRGVSAAFDAEAPLISLVHTLLDDPHGRVRFGALQALSALVRHFHSQTIERVAERMSDDEAWVRRHASEMLSTALCEAEEAKRTMPKSSLVFIAEGASQLLRACLRCYELGLTLTGGGDVHMRKIAVVGITSAAGASGEEDEEEEAAALSDEEDSDLVGSSILVEEARNKAQAADAMMMLRRCLKDKHPDVVDLAAKALLEFAAEGNKRAVEAVMTDMEAVLTHGLGVPGLGVKGTPESQGRGRIFGQEGIGTRQQQRRDNEEQRLLDEWEALQAKKAREEALQRELDILRMLANNGFVSKLVVKAFPQDEELEKVLELEAERPEMAQVRKEAAAWLGTLAERDDSNKAARAALQSYDEYLRLSGLAPLGERAAALVSAQEAAERVSLRPQPQAALCEELAEVLEKPAYVDEYGAVVPEDGDAKREAALRLAELVAQGDAAAEQVVLEMGREFLRALHGAGWLTDKTLKAVNGAPRSY